MTTAVAGSAPTPIHEANRRLLAAERLVEELERDLKDKARKHESVAKRETQLRNRINEVNAQIKNLNARFNQACRQRALDPTAGENPDAIKAELEKLQNTQHGIQQLLRDAEQTTASAHAPVLNLQRQLQEAREEAELARLNLKVNEAADTLAAARAVWDEKGGYIGWRRTHFAVFTRAGCMPSMSYGDSRQAKHHTSRMLIRIRVSDTRRTPT